jgi:hypothetical protein
MPQKNLTAAQARKISDAEARYANAKRELAEAKDAREEIRTRYRDRVPLGAAVKAGGMVIKRRVQTSGDSFRLSGFLEHNKLSAAMRAFVSKGTEFEVWDVRPDVAKTPRKKPAASDGAVGG